MVRKIVSLGCLRWYCLLQTKTIRFTEVREKIETLGAIHLMVVDSSKNDIDHGKHDKDSQENAEAAHSRSGWKFGVDARSDF